MGERAIDPGAWNLSETQGGPNPPASKAGPGADASADRATLTVEPTVEGVAEALSRLSASHLTTGPERSHPSRRARPPLVEVGESTRVPAELRQATPETGISLRLPADFEHLFVAAPLAYYLGAEVTVGERETPLLVAPEAGVAHDLSPLPEFQGEVSALLRRTFFIDTLARDIEGEDLAGRARALDRLGLDGATLRDCLPAERLAAYLSLPDVVDDHMPGWHLSTYVEPAPEHASSLPHLLAAMSQVYLPEASDLDRSERLERSLDDFYRATAEAASVDVLAPTLHDGDLHAWLAEGTPIDAYKTSHSALRNRLQYPDHGNASCEVAVVLNDEAMEAERAVADIYREEAAGQSMNVTVHEGLCRDELADVFEMPHDFVHYIGHCDVEGLRCPDGNLAAETLNTVRARAFFLNACGSYHEGRALVENGSAAGAVTLTSVLDEQAATVGRTLARLLVNGFGIARALEFARRRIMMGKDYAVVGDGTVSVVRGTDPETVHVTPTDGEFQVRYEVPAARTAGESYEEPFENRTYLRGVPAETTLDRETLVAFLRERSVPVVHDGQFFWSEALADRLAGGD